MSEYVKMSISVSGYPASFQQYDEEKFELAIHNEYGETMHKYKGDVDSEVIKLIEKFYRENKCFPTTDELNLYMEKEIN